VCCELDLIAGRVETLCGIWANCKSFLAALGRRTAPRESFKLPMVQGIGFLFLLLSQ
jgi:hypothetical protein